MLPDRAFSYNACVSRWFTGDDLKGSPARLWSLVEERTRPGADKASIDRRIDDLFGEEWAVMFTDLAGFSRNVEEFGIIHFLQVIHEQRKHLLPIVASHDGILIKEDADSFLALFRRAQTALRCALAMQQACLEVNEHRLPEEQILLCVGLGYGRILRIGDTDVFGSEVNAASKLGEDTAKAYEVLVTGAMREAARQVEGFSFEPLDVAVPGARSAFRVVRA
jgi:class 3 adenylate cyclase